MVFTRWLTAEASNGASLETQCCLMLIIMTSALLHPNVASLYTPESLHIFL